MHPIKGYGPSLADQGVGPEDAPLWTVVTNCDGCQIEYDPETGAATISYCADHDGEELDQVIADAQELSAQVQRLRTALRLACQDLRGRGVDPDALMADYLRAVDHAT